MRYPKTHQVLDLHYLPDEGQECFDGTWEECIEFAAIQSPVFMYKVVPMTKEEKERHPDNQEAKKEFESTIQKDFDKVETLKKAMELILGKEVFMPQVLNIKDKIINYYG